MFFKCCVLYSVGIKWIWVQLLKLSYITFLKVMLILSSFTFLLFGKACCQRCWISPFINKSELCSRIISFLIDLSIILLKDKIQRLLRVDIVNQVHNVWIFVPKLLGKLNDLNFQTTIRKLKSLNFHPNSLFSCFLNFRAKVKWQSY